MEYSKKMLFLVNPRSGRGQIKNRLLDILNLFSAAGYEVEVHITQKALDARDMVKSRGTGKDLIVCSGGDGTLNEVISGMAELDDPPVLGYIPAGSTNDFASSLKIPKNMVSAARTAVEGELFQIDIGRFCKDRYFSYVAGFGAFTEVSYLTPQDKKNLLGHQAYMLEGMKSLTSIKSNLMMIETEDQEIEGEFVFGVVTNTISIGGFKGLISGDVMLDDGLFEVLLVRTPKNPQEFSEILSSLILKEENNDQLLRFKARSLYVTSSEPVDWVLDGEFGGSHESVRIENLCQKLAIRRNAPKGGTKRAFIRKNV